MFSRQEALFFLTELALPASSVFFASVLNPNQPVLIDNRLFKVTLLFGCFLCNQFVKFCSHVATVWLHGEYAHTPTACSNPQKVTAW